MKYFEDFKVGEETQLPGKAVFTREAILEFAKEFDPQPQHLDDEAAKNGLLGALAAPGWHTTCAIARVIADYQNDNVAFVTSPGIEEARWKKPVFPGDELAIAEKILEARRSRSNPAVGLVRRLHTACKQDGTVAVTLDSWLMVSCRPGETSP